MEDTAGYVWGDSYLESWKMWSAQWEKMISLKEEVLPGCQTVSCLMLKHWPLALLVFLWSQFIFAFGKSSRITCSWFCFFLSVSYKIQVYFGRPGGFFFAFFFLLQVELSSLPHCGLGKLHPAFSLCFVTASGFSLVLSSRCKSLSSFFFFFAAFVFPLVPFLHQGLFPRCPVFYIRVVFTDVCHVFYAFCLPFSSSFYLGLLSFCL